MTTDVFTKNLQAYVSGIRRIGNKGGTWSTKTYSILQLLFCIADRHRTGSGKVISVISETLPHLKVGAIRDFERILRENNRYNEKNIDFSNHAYHFGNSVIEFYSADLGKVTGPRRDILYLNEVNHIPYEVVEQAEGRTRETIFYDFNPTEQFWFEDKVMSLPESERILIKSNYLDGMNVIPEHIAKDIEFKAERDPNFKRVHIDVEYGVYEGLIFPDWKQVESMPVDAKSILAMDFGFTNDPTTLIECALQNGEWWFDERLYRTGMTNQDIARFLKDEGLHRREIVADSSEPKSIKELQNEGVNVTGADKGPDSIRAGIDRIKSRKINVTKRSVNMIRELRNYRYKIDKNGISMNQPIDAFNHLIDPARYAALRMTSPSATGVRSSVISRR